MTTAWPPGPIPYPAIGRHGIVGDRRTAALVAADGTVDWLCLPDYDSLPAFGALLDARRGGFWRLGPMRLQQGAQHYAGVAPVLTTRWRSNDADLELRDAMALPCDDRDSGTARDRILIRRLTCLRGCAECVSALDRSLRLGSLIEAPASEQDAWRAARDSIRREVEARAWSERLGAFKQSIESDALDASTLLIPLSGFLPITDPRVRSTVEQIAARLTIDNCVYRFDPDRVDGLEGPPMGQYEAAFLPCTFWLARVFAMLGRTDRAAGILDTAERAAGRLGLFAEACDPRGCDMAGNTPLLFAHAEHIRAVQALEAAESAGRFGRRTPRAAARAAEPR